MFDPSAFGNKGRFGRRIGGEPFRQEFPVLRLEAADEQAGEFRFALFPRLLDGLFDFDKMRTQGSGPFLFVLLMEGREFAQVMRVAKGMTASVVKIRRPPVMHGRSRKVRKNACFAHAVFAALLVPVKYVRAAAE